MLVRGYKRWQLQRRWGGALGFARSGFSMVFGLGRQAEADEARQGQPSQAKPDRSARLGPPGRPWEPKRSTNHWFFPRARAKGSCCLRLPLGVWIELRDPSRRMKNQQKPMVFQHFQHESFKNQRFFNILRLREVPVNRKTNKNKCFFNIFNMEASKTNAFSTF